MKNDTNCSKCSHSAPSVLSVLFPVTKFFLHNVPLGLAPPLFQRSSLVYGYQPREEGFYAIVQFANHLAHARLTSTNGDFRGRAPDTSLFVPFDILPKPFLPGVDHSSNDGLDRSVALENLILVFEQLTVDTQ